MTAGLETFAKVRALHDRAGTPGEKAAAAGRMEALARSAGMTVAEAVSKLDSEASLSGAEFDWADMWEAARQAAAAVRAADAPEARTWRRGLPIYDPDTIEPWRSVAAHCLQLDRMIPKACGGKFLTKDERARLTAVTRYAPVTNADADWIGTVLGRCHAARDVWCERDRTTETPTYRKAPTESDVEFAVRMTAAMEAREASKLDTPEPRPRPQGPAQAFAESFAEFMNRLDFVAERNEREARRCAEAAEIIARYGSEDAVFEDTTKEAALRAACEPLLGPDETWSTIYRLDGWGSLDAGDKMPASLREAVSRGWPMPETVVAAWAEFEAADRLMGERCTVEYAYDPHLYVQARGYLLEEILNTLPARSLGDLCARGAWLAFQADAEVAQRPEEHRASIATLRADIERMGQRLREQGEAAVQNGQPASPSASDHPVSPCGATAQFCAAPSVQSGHPRRPSRAERHAAIRALLCEGHTDREVARRLGISPTTVGAVRRQTEAQHGR